jgi:RDD family
MSRGQAQLEPAFTGPGDEQFASISRRSLAWIIDVIAVTVLIFVGVSVVDEVFGPAARFHPEAATLPDVVAPDLGKVVLDALFATALSAGYFVLPWAVLGGSPGQLALRMRVRGDTGGRSLTVGRALARWILLFPPFATISALTTDVPRLGWLIWGSAPVWYLVRLLTTARSDTRQGLHDRLAGSVVRKRRAAG